MYSGFIIAIVFGSIAFLVLIWLIISIFVFHKAAAEGDCAEGAFVSTCISIFMFFICCSMILISTLMIPGIAKNEVEEFVEFSTTIEIMKESGYNIDFQTIKKISKTNAWLKKAKENKLKYGTNSMYYMEDLDKLHFIELKSKDNSLLLSFTLF